MWRPSGGKVSTKSPIFLGDSIETPEIRKPAQTECKKSAPFSRKLEKIEIFPTYFFGVTKISHLPIFDTIP